MYLELNGWETGLRFSACHFIPRHEKCRRLHGHVYAISARVHGSQDESGMVFDFLSLKRELRAIAEELDHRVLLPGNSRDAKITDSGEGLSVLVEGKAYLFPKEDCAVLDVSVCSAEELARFVADALLSRIRFPPNVRAIEIGVDEGRGQGAWFKREI